jgi:hypothetical protein
MGKKTLWPGRNRGGGRGKNTEKPEASRIFSSGFFSFLFRLKFLLKPGANARKKKSDSKTVRSL